MKKISIDFKNNAICFMLKNQQGTEFNPCLKNRKAFNGFIPGKYRKNNVFTWDFENNKFSIDDDIEKSNFIVKEQFISKRTYNMPGLSERYEEFVAILGYEQMDLSKDCSELLKKLFRIM